MPGIFDPWPEDGPRCRPPFRHSCCAHVIELEDKLAARQRLFLREAKALNEWSREMLVLLGEEPVRVAPFERLEEVIRTRREEARDGG